MNERRYGDDEVAAIFAKAADPGDVSRRPTASAGGMTLAELQEIGREVGLSADSVARAAAHLTEQKSVPTPPVSYPLTLRFRILAVARQLSVTGGNGQLLMYVKQKAFKLKEAITVYADEAQTRPLYRIAADRIIDFSATYAISDNEGVEIGAIRQKGARSLWRSHYEIVRDGEIVFAATEDNPWSRVANSIFEGVPIIGGLSGYVFHPLYVIRTRAGEPVVRVEKQGAFLESVFEVSRLAAAVPAADERLLLIGAVTIVLLERRRG